MKKYLSIIVIEKKTEVPIGFDISHVRLPFLARIDKADATLDLLTIGQKASG